jgi:hypothetical protein
VHAQLHHRPRRRRARVAAGRRPAEGAPSHPPKENLVDSFVSSFPPTPGTSIHPLPPTSPAYTGASL